MSRVGYGQEPRTFESPAVASPDDLVFGSTPRPVRCGLDLEIGAGRVFPEINFTLPPMLIDSENWGKVRATYQSTTEAPATCNWRAW